LLAHVTKKFKITNFFTVKLISLWGSRLRQWHLPAALLITLLQRTPVLRVVATSETMWTASPLGAVLRSAITGVAALGAVHALVGATQMVFNPRQPPFTGTVGATFSSVVFTVTGAQTPAGSFRITNVPPGLTVAGLGTNGILNASSAVLSGVPTAAGTFVMSVIAYEFNNAGGDAWPSGKASPYTIAFTIAASVVTTTVPTLTLQPLSQTLVAGTSVTLAAAAGGTPAPTYQWRKDGTNLPGATTPTLTLSAIQAAQAGDYTVVATNSAGSVASNPATLRVSAAAPSGRLSNLSVRAAMGTGQTLFVGLAVADGARDILGRAVGPALLVFNLANAMVDPRLDLFSGATAVFSNEDWPANLAATFASVGAFGLTPGSKDAAFLRNFPAGSYTMQARGTGAGVVLVEAYDTGALTPARLVNVSARNRVGTGDDILIAGFTITGPGSLQVLIRAVGPGLTLFGVPGVLVDPKLEIFNDRNVKVAENDNWESALASTFAKVAAFAINAGSRDAALLVELSPGSYTAQVRGADGGTGDALVEVYEVK
jgi:Immunoglobulin domain